MNCDDLTAELRAYYATLDPPRKSASPVWRQLDAHAAAQPEENAFRLKAVQYTLIAEQFTPVVFRNSPFYYEMGMKPFWCDGQPGGQHPGAWTHARNEHRYRAANPQLFDAVAHLHANQFVLPCGLYFDSDHHTFPFRNVIAHGLEHFFVQAQAERAKAGTPEEQDFLDAAMAGLRAAKTVGERFAAAARDLLADPSLDARQRRFAEMVARTAGEVPWRRPETFYEGLATLWFLRDVAGTLEGVGMNSLGAPDRMLWQLYRNDLAAGTITRAEAYDLICRFLLHGDCHYDKNSKVVNYQDHELEITFCVGGCDDQGEELCNDLTLMFIQAHHDLKLIYPKPHARYSSRSPKVYLDALNRDYLAGRSVWNILSDDLMIPALVAQGKRLEDARRYLVSGCWGVATEGCEPAAGAPYFNLLRILEASIRPDPQLAAKTGLALRSIEDAADFAEVYDIYADNLRRTIGLVCTAAREIGRHAPEVAPECFYSACLSDCLERHLDATAGGGRYNPQNFAIMSFANTVDSLVAIDELCFRRKRLGLPEFLAAVRADWRDQAALRAEVLGLPHFGDHTPASQGMAKRLFDDIHAATQARENARGGKFQLAFFVYREFIFWGRKMGATPDGRRAGERLSQGISPSQQYPASDLTDLIRSIAQLDLRRCGNSAVVYLNLPVDGMSLDHLETFERTCASMGVSMLQPNCVSTEELLDAKAHPENHPGLVVRVCGFSAKFTSLLPEWQDEFIARRIYGRSA